MLDTLSLGACNSPTTPYPFAHKADLRALNLLQTSNMDVEDFRKHGKEMVDYICSYMQTLPQRRVIPDVQPGYLKPLLPGRAPPKGEEWKAIMQDIEDYIMPGVSQEMPSYVPLSANYNR